MLSTSFLSTRSIMSPIRLVLPFTLLLLGLAISANGQTPKVNDSLIVTTDWLVKHLNDDSLVLLQIGESDEYAASHIPRAQFIQLADISTPRGQGLTLERAPVEQLKTAFERVGVSNSSRIVLYFGKDWVTPTARVFMTLDYLGLGNQTSILDGGLPTWRAEGRPVTSEVVEPKRGTFTPHPNPKLVVDASWVKENLNNPQVRI